MKNMKRGSHPREDLLLELVPLARHVDVDCVVYCTGYCTSICNCNLHYLGQKRCVSSKVPVSCLWLSVKCTEGIVGRALYHHFLPLQVWYNTRS